MLLEVIVQSVADARAAAAGGADRLEVVREIERDGLTPDIGLVRAITSACGLPLRVMVRESEGFTVKSATELEALKRAFAAFAALGVDGIVIGYARAGELDLKATGAILAVAPEQPITFHRAFDAAIDPARALAQLQAVPQVDRILTSGGPGDWAVRCRRLAEHSARAGARPLILAGGGVDEEGLRMLRSTGCVREAHVGRAACDPPVTGAPVSTDQVKRLKAVLEN